MSSLFRALRLLLVVGVPVCLVPACGASNARNEAPQDRFAAARELMVRSQLRGRDIRSERVLEVMARVERHRFIPEEGRDEAYGDHPVPIGYGQTISQPYIVAFMTEALAVEPEHRVLEIGTGSGYQAAVLSELAAQVYSIEIVPELADRARKTLSELGYRNVRVLTGNGYAGWPEHAPFDRVIVTAAPESVPPALVEQLKMDGLMAIPVGAEIQELRILRRTPTGVQVLKTLPVRFVPMTGKPK
jgi:protein-L-isoaspartate(D-aspartate) O-methyltransferase